MIFVNDNVLPNTIRLVILSEFREFLTIKNLSMAINVIVAMLIKPKKVEKNLKKPIFTKKIWLNYNLLKY